MGPYSMDLRERMLRRRSMRAGKAPNVEIAKRFRVSVSFVTRLLQRRRDAGTLTPSPTAAGRRPVLGFPNRYDWRC